MTLKFNLLSLLAVAIVALVDAALPVMEFSANLMFYYKEESTAATITDEMCKADGCDNAINSLLTPWREWAMEQHGHSPDDYTCNDFDDYNYCPRYPIFAGHKSVRYCSRCTFTNDAYQGVDDIALLINTTTLKWVQTHTIDGVRRVLHPTDEQQQGCPCLGLKYKHMVDYYVSEEGQRRRNRKFMRV